MRIGVQAAALGLAPSDPRHAETRGLLELLASSAEEVIFLVPAAAARHVPPGLQVQPVEMSGSGLRRLKFEVRDAAHLAAGLRADILYCLGASAPWRSSIPFVVEETGSELPNIDGDQRLASALRRAGAGAAAARLVPSDLPPRGLTGSVRRVPPAVATRFRAGPGEVPRLDPGRWGVAGDYVLAWPCSQRALSRLMAGWTWVDGSLGDSVSLLLLCASETLRAVAMRSASEMGLQESVRAIVLEDAADLPVVFRGARAFMGVEAGPIPQVFRWALAAGVPIVGETSTEAESITGDAAYLVAQGQTRALGAAALTVLVEDEVAQSLRHKGMERAKAYDFDNALRARMDVLRSVTAGRA